MLPTADGANVWAPAHAGVEVATWLGLAVLVADRAMPTRVRDQNC